MQINTLFTKRVKKSLKDLRNDGFKCIEGRSPKWRKYIEETDTADKFYEYRSGTLQLIEIIY